MAQNVFALIFYSLIQNMEWTDVLTCLKSLMEPSLTLHPVWYQLIIFLLVSDSQEP